ncbi:MAG: hypothetical protein HFI34_05870 [Lachnospiraceae bacterium]|nr:hypothetical protein [Lachnospiraceae bacterium]
MLNEEKIRLMTKLALYEEKKGKKALSANKYFRNDYISINMINTVLTVSFAYLLGLVLWVVYKVDYFMQEITNIDLIALGKQVLLIYVIVLIIFLFISYVVYSVRYRNMKIENREYADNLKELYLMYKREEKHKNEYRPGGDSSDDENFGF